MSSAGTSSQYNTPVVVNLNVQVDTSGNLVVFGEQAPTTQNVITATVNLPVRALYDASGASNGGLLNSLFEFWEPEDALGERRATLSGKDASGIPLSNRDYTKMSKKFVCDLQAVLDGSFDCSGASPYDDPKYASTTVYNTQSNFGRLALSTYAHYLFGHLAATSAITNDQQFMDAMLSKVNGAYKYASASAVEGLSNGSQWTNTGSSTDADLARQLVGSIITKNNEAILAIVNQVLGQDASRAMDQDNNALAPGVRHALKFIANDTIFMNIKLITPSITVGNGQLVQDTTLQNKYTEETYMLKITLSDAEGVAFPSTPTGSAEININLYTLTNVIPDTDPSGNALTNPGLNKPGTRFFKHSFTATAGTPYDVYINTNSFAGSEEIIYSIYQEGSGNIISDTTTNITDLSGVSFSGTTIALTDSLSNINVFTLTNLISGTYYIITKTTYNDTDVDVGLGLFNGTNQIPLTYTETGTTLINNKLCTLTNVIPDVDPSGNALTIPNTVYPGTRFFKYSFTAIGSTYDAYMTTNFTAQTEEIIYSIYQEGSGNIINPTTTDIINLDGVSFSGTTITLTSSLSNRKAFTLTNLTSGTYYIIVKTISNNQTGMDVGIGLFDATTQSQAVLTYVSTGTTEAI
jgi:hypothetical protein